MSEIRITNARKAGIRELNSGDINITFHVEREQRSQVLPLLMLSTDDALDLTITDASNEPAKSVKDSNGNWVRETSEPKDSDRPVPRAKSDRGKKYARIEILCTENGYSEEKKRELFTHLTGHKSKKNMSDQDLDEVIAWLVEEQ